MFKTILVLAKPFWARLIGIAILILIMSALKQVEPMIAQRITDALVGQRLGIDLLVRLLGILLLVRLVITLMNRGSWSLTTILTEELRSHLRQIGYEHLLGLSLNYFNQSVSGKLMSQLDRGVNRLTEVVNNSGMHFVPAMVTGLMSMIIVMQYSWWLGLLAISSFIPFGLISWWRFVRNEKLEKKEHALYDTQFAHFWETISSIQLIKAFHAETYESRQLKSFHAKLLSIRKAMERNNNVGVSGDVVLDTWMWGLYAVIVWMAMSHSITIGEMVLLSSYIWMIREPLWTLNWIYWEIRRAQLGAKEYMEILEAQPQVVDPQKPITPQLIKGRITFDEVSFGYEQGEEVLSSISFSVQPGQMVALVGPSGSGKTTIASLIMRFYDPTSGRILIDGIDVKSFRQRELRAQVGIVMQEAQLFADSVAENLKYGKPTASRKELEQAARIANAHEFIKTLPKKYDTQIGERGVMLSGGQKQRLSIARTVLKNPPIIILDEATSALDSHSEQLIQQSLHKLLRGRTSLVIAHRLSTVARADLIIVLKDGGVLEQGSHQMLMKTQGLYSSLWDIQTGRAEALKEWDLVE